MAAQIITNAGPKVVLAPMVRIGELPTRLVSLHYGADAVWGPEIVDKKLIQCKRVVNEAIDCVDYYAPSKNAGGEVLVFRTHPVETKCLTFQIGTADPALAVQAAKIVAPDISIIEVNAGCPKHFSVHSGMGAGLLKDIPKLVAILTALVEEVGKPYGIGVAVKTRLLDDEQATQDMIRKLCRTGIKRLTIHCRTTPMRNTERALRERLAGVAKVCREEGVLIYGNGDVEDRKHAVEIAKEYDVDGLMIARAAERNPSCFREEGVLPPLEVAKTYLKTAMEVDNPFPNTKYCLQQILAGMSKSGIYKKFHGMKTFKDLAALLDVEYHEKPAERVSAVRRANSAVVRAAGGDTAKDVARAATKEAVEKGECAAYAEA
ncbi:hypothetical protein G7K_4848-t1 [Saitoella complicata NRRL Y-17804]|uniref:DUS-like FMN-binding domain-containing protein n=2 Tax=Saitoella complicata (strain BCRC 22490 / CBS 7301 / JCM 7358 / NBRC 10748 / NRRL Y-17804) TaxID=698492 RepID=A0A0E9NLG7_SAICN|nr:hypothetical protein G7K_4848-t1 [Saitoella complicata NRRL Y-17804]